MGDHNSSASPLKRVVVDLHVKNFIIDSIVGNARPPSKVAKALSLNRKTVEKVAQKGRKGYIFHEQEGRPRKLDAEAMVSLRNFLCQHPNATTAEKYVAIQREHTIAHQKLNTHSKLKPLSRRSLGRYLSLLEKEPIL